MADQEFIDHQYELLKIYRRNLRLLLEQAAQHGGEGWAPLELRNQIGAQRGYIAQVRTTLRELGEVVAPQEGDLPPNREDEAARIDPLHNLTSPGYREFVARPRYQSWLARSLASRYPIVLVCGLGGNGKSSLVYETAYRAISGDTDVAQFEAAVWVSDKGDKGITLTNICDVIAHTLGHRGWTQYNDDVKRREVEHLLRNRKTLLVIDNFETIRDQQIYPWLKEQLPAPSKAIITTRSYDETFIACDVIRLGGMTNDEARSFLQLQQQASQFEDTPELSPDQVDALIAAAGGNPKVMDVALGMLLRDRHSYVAVLHDLQQARGDVFDDLFASVWAALSQHARTLLMAATLFVEHARSDALAAITRLNTDQFSQALKQLRFHALLDVLRTTPDAHADTVQRFTLHQLVRSYTLQRMKTQKRWVAGARNRQTRWAIDYLKKFGWDWKQPERLRQLALDEQELYAILTASVPDDGRATLALAQGLDHYYYVEGHWDKKQQIDLWRIAAANRLGETNEEARSIAQYIQFLSRKQELPEALRYQERLQALRKQGDLTPDVVVQSEHAFAFLAIAQQDYSTALSIFDSCDTTRLTDLHGNLVIANAHWQAYCTYKLGRLDAARELFQHTLIQALRVQYRRSAVFCRLHLAKIAIDQGDVATARPLLDTALGEASAIDEQRYIAQIKLCFARLAIRQRAFEEAQSALSDASALYGKLHLFDDRDLLLQTLEDLARLVAIH